MKTIKLFKEHEIAMIKVLAERFDKTGIYARGAGQE